VIRLLASFALLLCALTPAYAGSVHILLSDTTQSYQTAATAITAALKQQAFSQPVTITPLKALDASQVADDDLIVTIGKTAAQQSQQRFGDKAQIYSYIDHSAVPDTQQPHWAAIVLDQPLQRLLDFTRHIVKDRYRNKIVIAVSEQNQVLINEIKALKTTDAIELEVVIVNKAAEPAKVIDKALFNAGALIAIRDQRIWSGENAKWMLYQSYKYNVPVIGYSKSFLKAGALASVYASLPATADKTAQLISDWANKGKLTQEGIQYPRYQVEFNRNIARALKIDIADIPAGEDADVRD
jgi:ABC-type uncharacterized transport system substrate-binding protein